MAGMDGGSDEELRGSGGAGGSRGSGEQRFPDHFSGCAASYASARPTYPAALFERIAAACPRRERAWDCGAGSGQATAGLARHFEHVVASDASAEQIARLSRPTDGQRVQALVAAAERPPLADGSLDLVAVAQALHWFDLERFWPQVRRVLRPGGVVAAWCYGLFGAEGELGAALRRFHEDVEAAWPPERCHIEAGYATLSFPFAPVGLEGGPLEMSVSWDLERLLAYLGTWSAVSAERARGVDPLAVHARALGEAWGDPRAVRTLRWPLTLLLGRV